MKKKAWKCVALLLSVTMASALVSCTKAGTDKTVVDGLTGGEYKENRKDGDETGGNPDNTVTDAEESPEKTGNEAPDAEEVFKKTLAWLKTNGGKELTINFQPVKYRPGKRSASLNEASKPDELLPFRSPSEFIAKRVRMTRKDNGAAMDFDVYAKRDNEKLYLIEAVEYGTVRESTRYYFDENGRLCYVSSWEDNPLGTLNRLDTDLPGKKCVFAGDTMLRCEITDAEEKYNGSYSAKDYSKFDSFLKKQYDQLEKDYVNQAYCILDAVKSVPGYARVYGYAADEFGGTLKGTEVEISSVEHDYRETMETDDDGFFAFYVPVNTLGWYNLKFNYGDYLPSEIDDVCIRPLTVDYCAGVAYMAPPGGLKHEQYVYLMNINEKPDEKLSEGEYEVTLTFDGTKAELMPYGLITGNEVKELSVKAVLGGEKTVYSLIVDSNKIDDFKLVVRDEKGIAEDNPYSYDMSLSGALVKIYNCDGIAAAFPVPAGAAGVTWECAEILAGRIVPRNNYYQEALNW
ncbi:MAG: hypothetical protein K5985_10095 [Lachnospiraceae bacterium]|nr:hypothetical protein [Lachnospiraceae bacterium]